MLAVDTIIGRAAVLVRMNAMIEARLWGDAVVWGADLYEAARWRRVPMSAVAAFAAAKLPWLARVDWHQFARLLRARRMLAELHETGVLH